MVRSWRLLGVVPVLWVAAGCGQPAAMPTAPSASAGYLPTSVQASQRCINVALEGVAALGIFDGALGAAPTPVTLAGVTGTLGSIVTSLSASGRSGRGAQHITLRHAFRSDAGTFTTDDRAVCAPAGADPHVCGVNDVMRIVSGTGVFSNASGHLVNHGIIDLNRFTLSYSARGRVCGDGL